MSQGVMLRAVLINLQVLVLVPSIWTCHLTPVQVHGFSLSQGATL